MRHEQERGEKKVKKKRWKTWEKDDPFPLKKTQGGQNKESKKKETKDTQWKRRKNFSWKNEIYKKTCKQQKREQTKEKKKRETTKCWFLKEKRKIDKGSEKFF